VCRRIGSFVTGIASKRARRLSNTNEMIVLLYSRGMTTGDLAAQLGVIYGIEASKK
jgi:hypothetical protein